MASVLVKMSSKDLELETSIQKMSCSTPVSSLGRRRCLRSRRSRSKEAFSEKKGNLRHEVASQEEEDGFYLSQVPVAEDDSVFWAFDNPELDEELHRKITALDEASPTCRKKARSTPNYRLRIAGASRRNNNNDRQRGEEAKEFLSQCFGDFLHKKAPASKGVVEEEERSVLKKVASDTSSFLFDEDEEEILLLASQAVDSSIILKKTPISLSKTKKKRLSDPFEDESFDNLLSQLPEEAFNSNKSSPAATKLSLKRHGTAEDFGTPKSSTTPLAGKSRLSSLRRNNSAPVVESPAEVIQCSAEEIRKKKEAALKKRTEIKSLEMKQDIENKRREALRRRKVLPK